GKPIQRIIVQRLKGEEVGDERNLRRLDPYDRGNPANDGATRAVMTAIRAARRTDRLLATRPSGLYTAGLIGMRMPAALVRSGASQWGTVGLGGQRRLAARAGFTHAHARHEHRQSHKKSDQQPHQTSRMNPQPWPFAVYALSANASIRDVTPSALAPHLPWRF